MSVRKMERSVISYVDLGNTMNCMEITKGNHTNLVLQSHEFVVVMDRYESVGNVPFIKLAKSFDNPSDAYDEWLHVIGKMCKKSATSKYFDKPKYEEHLRNGEFSDRETDTITNIAETARSLINEVNEQDFTDDFADAVASIPSGSGEQIGR